MWRGAPGRRRWGATPTRCRVGPSRPHWIRMRLSYPASARGGPGSRARPGPVGRTPGIDLELPGTGEVHELVARRGAGGDHADQRGIGGEHRSSSQNRHRGVARRGQAGKTGPHRRHPDRHDRHDDRREPVAMGPCPCPEPDHHAGFGIVSLPGPLAGLSLYKRRSPRRVRARSGEFRGAQLGWYSSRSARLRNLPLAFCGRGSSRKYTYRGTLNRASRSPTNDRSSSASSVASGSR